MPLLQTILKSIAYRFGFSLRRLRPASRLAGKGTDFTGRVRPLLHRIDPYEDFDLSRPRHLVGHRETRRHPLRR